MRIKSILILLLFFSQLTTNAQDCDTTLYEIVEEMPEYPSGQQEMYKYFMGIDLPQNIPQDSLISSFYFQFTVTCDGKIEDIRALKNPDHSIAKYYVEQLKLMPDWIPGKHHGIPVNVNYTLPLKIHWR